MKRTLYSGVGLLLVAVIFLLFNAIAAVTLKNIQLDLTQDQLYTLTSGTQELLVDLDEPIQLYYFYSSQAARDLPQVRHYAQRVNELLQTYQRLANGKIRLEVIDPEPFSEQEDKAAEMGLQAIPMAQGDPLYFGLAGKNSQGQVHSIAFFSLDQEAFLEYELSRLVHALAQGKLPVVGVMSGLELNGGFDIFSGQPRPVWMMLEEVRQQFQVQNLSDSIDEIPADIDVLWLVHPKDLGEPTLYALDQFVLRGGKLLVFVDPLSEADTSPSLQLDQENTRSSQLDRMLTAWGVRLRPDSILADAAYAMQVGVGQQQRPVRHLGWLSVPAQGLNQDDILTAQLTSLTLATAGILEPLEQATTRFTPLIQSSEAAMVYASNRFSNLRNPAELLADMQPTGERYALAARISGPAQTAFPQGLEGQQAGLKQADNIQVVVVADTDILSDRLWVQTQDFFGRRLPQPWADNANFVINALDNLSGSHALISVRSRGRFSRPFEVVERLRQSAETRYRDKEQELQQRLAQAEEQLAQLQQDSRYEDVTMRVQEQAAIQQFLQERMQIRKQLREVRYQLNADIESLGTAVKLFNIAVMPIALTFFLVVVGLQRRIRRLQVTQEE